jgi:hypothetical protein
LQVDEIMRTEVTRSVGESPERLLELDDIPLPACDAVEPVLEDPVLELPAP